MISTEIKRLCAVLCVVTWCEICSGNALHKLSLNKLVTRPAKRISRSPGTYIADENGQRVIIITAKRPEKSDAFNNNSSGASSYFGNSSLSDNNNDFAGGLLSNYNPSIDVPTTFRPNSNRNNNAQSSFSGNFIPNQSQGNINQQNSFPGQIYPNRIQGYINQPRYIPGNYNPNYNQGYLNQPNNIPSNFNPIPNPGYINQPNNFPGYYNPSYNQGYNYQPNGFPSNYYPNNNGYNYQQGGFSSNQGYTNQQDGSYNQPSSFPNKLFSKPRFVVYPSPEEERIKPHIAEPYENSNNINIPIESAKIPGALKIIELLKGLGIPFLQTPNIDTTTTPRISYSAPSSGLSGIGPIGDARTVGESNFGADLNAGFVQGGFRDKKVNAEDNS